MTNTPPAKEITVEQVSAAVENSKAKGKPPAPVVDAAPPHVGKYVLLIRDAVTGKLHAALDPSAPKALGVLKEFASIEEVQNATKNSELLRRHKFQVLQIQ